ncbi:hypothetical protein Tco_0033664 [Tanacetum coccineum]
MEHSFLSQNGGGGGRGVNEKQQGSTNITTLASGDSANDTIKDIVMVSSNGDELNEALGTNPDTSAPKVVNEVGENDVGTGPAILTLNPVWVKLYGVPDMAFSEDGLSIIATKLGQAMIEFRDDVELKDNIVVAMPKITREGFYTCNIHVDSPSTTPIIEKIDKIEKLINDGKVNLVDDEGNPLEKGCFLSDYDSEDEVASVDNEMASFFAKKDGYGTQSLLEQWKESYKNDDYKYDIYDDDMYEG